MLYESLTVFIQLRYLATNKQTIPMIQYCKGKKTNGQAELFFENSIYSTPLSSDHHAKFRERFSSIYQRLDI